MSDPWMLLCFFRISAFGLPSRPAGFSSQGTILPLVPLTFETSQKINGTLFQRELIISWRDGVLGEIYAVSG